MRHEAGVKSLCKSLVFGFGAAVLALGVPSNAPAQQPGRAVPLSAAAVADSLVVLERLRSVVRSHPSDTSAWFRRGMIAFGLAMRAREPEAPRSLDERVLRLEASDALNAAFELDQNNPDHYFAIGEFYGTAVRELMAGHKSRSMFERAYERFYQTADRALKLELLLRMGDEDWFFYNKFESRAMALGKPPMSVTRAAGRDTLSSLPRLLARASARVIEAYGTRSDFELAGEAHYLAARKYYEQARRVAPNDERAFRSLAKLYATRDSWEFLLALAADYTQQAPDDPWGWLALGLAQHRRARVSNAAASFDSGFARMSPSLRSNLDRLDRVLRPVDSAQFVAADSASRAQMTAYYWPVADPLWTTHREQPRLEFLARLAYAEVRYGALQSPGRGPDSPEGQLYVRYGPPTLKRENFWLYPSGLVFALPPKGRPTLNRSDLSDTELVQRIKNWQPARWDNIAETTIDSMPTQIARFRAPNDSVDFFLATRAPLDTLRAVTPANTELLTKFWLLGLTTKDPHGDSLPMSGTGALQWTRRLQAGQYYFRVEASAVGMARAARTSALMMMTDDPATGFSLRGFGMSDIIVASSARAPGTARSWRDLDISPVLTTVSRSGKVALIWETYEPGQRAGIASYTVSVTLELDDASASGRVAAHVVRGTTGTGSMTRRGRNSITYTFDRSIPVAQTIVESFDIQLENTPPGDYFVRIAVTDKVSGRTTSRSTGIVIR